jgi:DNA-binding NarL/FixJ family response regulator
MDARKATPLLRKTKPDVVVMGLADPNGPDLDYCIWNVRVYARVLVLTAHAEPGCILRALQLGAHGVLLKWATDTALVDAVRAVQAGGTYISGEASSALLRAYLELRSDMEMTVSKIG